MINKIKSYVRHYGARELCQKAVEKLYNRDNYDRDRYNEIVEEEEIYRQKSFMFEYAPLISIIMPTYNTKRISLIQTLTAVKEQTYSNWELCIADGGDKKILSVIKEVFGDDDRIKYVSLDSNLGISGNSNEAIRLASGEFISLLDHDDIIEPDALFETVKAIQTGAEFIYTDEDKVTENLDRYFDHYKKTDFNMPLLLSNNYICHFTTIKKSIVDAVGGFRSEYDGAQDYDLFLRCVRHTDKITHIPKTLYHWRATSDSTSDNPFTKEYAYLAGKKAIEDYIGDRGSVKELKDPGFFRIYYNITGDYICLGTSYEDDDILPADYYMIMHKDMIFTEYEIDVAVACANFYNADIVVPKIVSDRHYVYNGIADCGNGHTPSLKGKPDWFRGKFNLAQLDMEVASVPRYGIIVRGEAIKQVLECEGKHITNKKGSCKGLRMVYCPQITIRM